MERIPIDEVIKDLETIKPLVEWEYPLDFQLSLDEAIRILKEVQDGRQSTAVDR